MPHKIYGFAGGWRVSFAGAELCGGQVTVPGYRFPCSPSIDRRRFLKAAGMFAAASAVGSRVTGCGVTQVEIPCLGPAEPPTPVPGMTYIRASEIGCALDCDLATGRHKQTGGRATDDGPRINAAMAGASSSHPVTLIIDGSALISGLFLPAGGYWNIAGLGCGTGFFVQSGTNNDGIHNGDPAAAIPSDPGPPAPPRGKNVSLSNFTLNGNQGDGHRGNSTSGMRQGNKTAWFFGINLMSLDNVTVENVVVVNSPAFHFRFSNCGNVKVTGCVMQSKGPSTDGLHFDGPANDITISNCRFSTGDDAIALNCPEGYMGNISRVTVTDCTFDSWSLMRLYTTWGGPTYRINDVSVSNCNGTFDETAFFIGLTGGSLPDSVTGLTVSNCDLTAPTVVALAENFGSLVFRNVVFHPNLQHVMWTDPQATRLCAFMRPSPAYGGAKAVGSSLTLENCQVMRLAWIDVPAVILENSSHIEDVVFSGYSVGDRAQYLPIGELLHLAGGSVGQLVLDKVDSDNIRMPVEPYGYARLGMVSGAGVLQTGWPFPDQVMAEEVPYISARTGRPSIKVDGLVESYDPA